MAEPMIKPEAPDRSYVTVKDKRTGKAKCVTVYDLRPAQVIEALRLGIDVFKLKHTSGDGGPAQKKTPARTKLESSAAA